MTILADYKTMSELDWFNIEPNDRIDPRLFTGSLGINSAIFVGPLGWDYLYCRGVDLLVGISPLRELTYELFVNYDSPYRPGVVNKDDKMSIQFTRSIQFPREKIFLSGGLESLDLVPKFGRTRPNKVLVKRDFGLVFTFTDIIVPKADQSAIAA